MSSRLRPLALVVVTLALIGLAGCQGPGAPTPTAIPADVARPAQSTPVFSTAEPRYRLGTETPPVFLVTPTVAPIPADLAQLPPAGADRGQLLAALLMNQPPSAMGITPGGATLLDAPGGEAVLTVPGASALTVTGRSADGNWLAVFTSEAIPGWVPAGAVQLFGEDDLGVVEQAFSPAPVATMLAEAMIPAGTPMATYFAQLTQTPLPPMALPETPTPLPNEPAAEPTALLGIIVSDGNLNLRARPESGGAVVASLPPESEVIALARTADGGWLRVRAPAGDGWVASAFVVLEGEAATLAVEP